MSDGAVELTLRCGVCGKTERPKIIQRWAPEGCLEIAGGTRFYVDGREVRCPEHVDRDKDRQQRRSKQFDREMEPTR